MDFDPEFHVGEPVIAVDVITECGNEGVDPDAGPCEPGWLHAEPGDRGWVEYVDASGYPTVRFERTRTATVVFPFEVAHIVPMATLPEA